MMVFEPIKDELELFECIGIAFNGDDELVNTYHIVNDSYYECVVDTYAKIKEAESEIPIDSYKVIVDGVIIGYICICKEIELLYSFGINMLYRTQAIFSLWFKKVKKLVGNFACCLWNKNTRAIQFLEKMGMIIADVKEEYTILRLCQ